MLVVPPCVCSVITVNFTLRHCCLKEDVQIVRCKSIARMKLQILVVGCILQSIHGSPDNSNSNTIEKLTNALHDDYTPNYRPLTPQDIDRDSINIIAGGRFVPEELAPYQCSLQVFEEHFCGCAIINENFVVTASHCVVGKSENWVRIMVGSNELRSGGTYYEAERLISHEHYNTPEGAYDIALVKVKGPIEFSDKVRPIELDDREVPDGAEVQLTGWGNIEAGYIPNKLQYVKLHILLKNICKKARFGDHIQDHHVCTISLKGGACRADSGGPLVYDKKLAGIVNFGLPVRCGLGNPDVYAKVSSFADWIRKHSSM